VLCDAGYATHLLGHWARERGLFSWEEAVRRLTAMPAAIYGLGDRGRLVPGTAADVVCFDPTRVGSLPAEKVHDLPAGAARWIVRATGIVHVLVNGEPLITDGATTGAMPGRLLAPTARD
jgi:N-acyl-D-aspartate/D-glutamate deacylase